MFEIVRDHVLDAGLALLPPRMDSPAARRMLLAIGLQESRFKHRRQIMGPARGFWQFEVGGVRGVIRHPATKDHLKAAVVGLNYSTSLARSAVDLQALLEHNDILACVLARLNLWWLSGSLSGDQEGAWRQYLSAWRPGKAKPKTWAECWRRAGEAMEAP